MPDNNKNKGKNKKDNSFDKQSFKKGIAYIESRSYKNPYEALPYYTDKDGSKKLASSASGKYQFLWKELSESNPQLLSGITKEQFLKNPELQEKVMDMAIEGGLRNRPSYYKNAMDIKNEFQKSFGDNWNFRDDEIAALTHFLGRGGTRQYLRSLLNDTKFKTPGEINVKPLKYLEEYNKGIGRERGLLKTNENNNIDIINNSHLNDITLKPATQDNLKLDNFLQTNKILPDLGIERKAYTQDDIKPSNNGGTDDSITSFLHNYLSSNNLAYGGIIDPPEKTNISSDEVVKSSKDFMTDWFNHPVTRIKLQSNIMDQGPEVASKYDANQVINKSIENWNEVPHQVFKPNPTSSIKGMYNPGENKMSFFGQPNKETSAHEILHSGNQGLDKIGSDFIKKNYGNPHQAIQAKTGTKNTTDALVKQFDLDPSSVFDRDKIIEQKKNINYLSNPEELYPRIMEMRRFLNVVPGQEINDEHIQQIQNSDNEGVKRLFDIYEPEQIKSMLNTLAHQDNNTSNNNYAALGGKQNTNNMNQLLTEFNEGGTHEQNPFGGIFQGIGNNGKPNTVEEGETKAGGYVFSDRLKLDAKTLKKYKLPTNLKNKTAAEASKELNKQYKESLSNIDKESTKEMLSRLTAANDELRIQENPSSPQDNNQMFLGGREQQTPALSYQPQGMQQMIDPNALLQQSGNKGASELAGIGGEGLLKGAGSGGGPGVGGYMNVASTALDFGNQLFGDSGIDESGTQRYEKVNKGGEALGGAMKGAQAGMAFGPWGAAIGGVVGGITGLISGGKKQKEVAEANHNFTLAQNSKLRESDFAYGGKISNKNKYAMGGFTDDEVYDDVQDFLRKQSLEKPLFDISGQTGTNMFSIMDDAPNNNSNFDFGNLANNAMRYAPVATNLLQLSKLGNPEVERLDKLDKRYQPDYVDEQSLINKVSNAGANVRRSLTESSGGDLGGLRTNLLASQINEAKGLSDAFMQAEDINRRENQLGQQFNLNVDRFNIGQSNTEKDINARNRAAYENNRSKLISQLGTDIGNIGLENLRKKYPERAGLLYDYLGSLITDKETT